MKRSESVVLSGWLAVAVLIASACSGATEYPTRPLTLIVPWAAGGGTDAVARVMAGLIERDLGKPVNVVNRTGGSGVVGHQAIASARPDGYTLGIVTVEIAMMHHQGLTELTGEAFTLLGSVNFDGGAIQVRADSPYRTLGDLLQAIRANPGKLNASGTAQGGIWHVFCCRRSGRTPASSMRQAPPKVVSGTSPWQACSMSSASRRQPWSGCRATEARPRCSISSPAASTS